jgi:pyruvate dehydrogenase E2 component (dihydrolipoamide acetyltransferase)
MAKFDIVMPQMGESITNGTITKWRKQVGDKIDIDEILLDISTDKVESEIPSPVAGIVEELLFPEGKTIDVGIKIAVIEDDPAAAKTSSSPAAATPAPAASSTPAKEAAPAAKAVSTSVASGDSVNVADASGRRFYTPLVRKMSEELGIQLNELMNVEGTGSAGRVNKQDLLNYVENKKSSGKPSPAQATSSVAATPASTSSITGSGRVEVIPMDNMRKAIAKNMVMSKQISPHVNSIGEVDLTHLVKFRDKFKDTFFKQEGFKLTFSPFIMYAIVQALKDHPMVNASIDGDNIILKKDINLGCAVAVPGNGLVVPVIKNADNLNLRGICRAVNQLAEKARSKKLTMDELTGGTFTFTNVGSFGTLLATPIILQPQLGIYASGVIQKRVVVMEDDAIAVRSMMYGTHSYDHRLVDGELGGKFLESIHRHLREMKPEHLF